MLFPLDVICLIRYIAYMAWSIEGTDEFQEWFAGLTHAEQDSIGRKVELLEHFGPALGRPDADGIKGSKYPNMKELRIQHGGDAYRVLYAFDPRRVAILLMGGRKGKKKWYEKAIAAADGIYERYLDELKSQGLI